MQNPTVHTATGNIAIDFCSLPLGIPSPTTFSAVTERALKGRNGVVFPLLPTLSALLQVLMCEHVKFTVKPTRFIPVKTKNLY